MNKILIILSIFIASLVVPTFAQDDNSTAFLGLEDPLTTADPVALKDDTAVDAGVEDDNAIPAIGSDLPDDSETNSGDVVVVDATNPDATVGGVSPAVIIHNDDTNASPSGSDADVVVDTATADEVTKTATATASAVPTVSNPIVANPVAKGLLPTNSNSNTPAFISACMTYHNTMRAAVGTPSLSWSSSLAAQSTNWSKKMASSGSFRHSGTAHTGENIAMTSSSTDTLFRLFRVWMIERNTFRVGCTFPNCQKTSAEVGHYTAMVWRTTKQVGCGWATGGSMKYLTCQYLPSGNVLGSKVY